MRPHAMLSLEKSPKLKRTFAQRPITNIAVSTDWRAPRCGTAWTATVGRSHTTASRRSSTRVRSLGARWKVEGKAVSEIPVASSRPKRRAFDASTLRLLEELCESTWAIVQDRHPFRDLTNDSDLKHQLRRKLFILAENSDLEDLDGLQRSVLEAFARGVDN